MKLLGYDKDGYRCSLSTKMDGENGAFGCRQKDQTETLINCK